MRPYFLTLYTKVRIESASLLKRHRSNVFKSLSIPLRESAYCGVNLGFLELVTTQGKVARSDK